MRPHDRQGHDGLSGPAREVVDVQREPFGQEDHLGRQGRHVVPRPQPEQCQPQVREDARPLHAPRVADERGGLPHVRGVDRISGQP